MYDDQNLYVLIEADAQEDSYITPTLRRDFSSRNSDSVTLVLDTFKSPLYNLFPKLEFLLFSLYETLKDVQLFIKDLI